MEQCAGGHMEADEWERTVCSERGKEKSFFGEKFSSPLGLCCFFLAALAFFFWSPFVSLTLLLLPPAWEVLPFGTSGIDLMTLLLLPPAWEDWKTGYVSDYWSVFLAAAGLGHNVFYSRLTDGFISCAFVLGLYGLLFLLAKHAMGAGDIFLSGAAALWLPLPPRLLQAWCFFSLAECPAGRGFLSARSSRWEVWRHMARKYFSFRSFHRGTVLFEALLVSVILSLAALAVIPLYTGWWFWRSSRLSIHDKAGGDPSVHGMVEREKAGTGSGGSGFGDTAGGNPCEK